jgi:UDP-glucose 4-epimerase
MRVLVTGGAGYIGSVVVQELLASRAERVVVLDDLSNGHREAVETTLVVGDIGDARLVSQICEEEGIDSVIHLAGSTQVAESVANPAKYYDNNLLRSMLLLNVLREKGVQRIVFSSTAAVYGVGGSAPITEEDPLAPINPYGDTKLGFEKALAAYNKAYGLRYTALRYFNAAGATEKLGEHHEPETHLIPLLLRVALGKAEAATLFGDDYPTLDGTCVRDYIHVSDLARAHVLALERMGPSGSVYNLGCGGGYSVKQVLQAAREVTGKPIPANVAPRRAGDPPVLIASSERIQAELGWRPEKQQLKTIVEDAWNWSLRHPNGYSS